MHFTFGMTHFARNSLLPNIKKKNYYFVPMEKNIDIGMLQHEGSIELIRLFLLGNEN